MRIYTGSPKNFMGTQMFFDRDSGLTSRGLEAIGISSKTVTLLPAKPDDLPQLMRASWEQFHDVEWWKSQNLDGLVLYTWGKTKFRKVLVAAMAAGIKVAQVTDTQGIFSPVADFTAHLQSEQAHYWHEPALKRIFRTICKLPLSCTIRIFGRDRARARAIATSDFFFAPTPRSAQRYQILLRKLVGKDAAQKVHFVPVPVNFHFIYDSSIAKQDEVVAVGRWNSIQKRTPLLMSSITHALSRRSTTTYRIFGKTTPELKKWHQSLSPVDRSRVLLEGMVPNSELAQAYQRARVMLVSAAFEGCHNSSAEALCCGATVVACRSPFLGALEWHASKSSGRLARKATGSALAEALLDELSAWDQGERDPKAISQAWTEEMLPDRVARKIVDIFGESQRPGHTA
jgi:hypothetical protein